MQWSGLTARKIDFRRKSNSDWVVRIEKSKVVRNQCNAQVVIEVKLGESGPIPSPNDPPP